MNDKADYLEIDEDPIPERNVCPDPPAAPVPANYNFSDSFHGKMLFTDIPCDLMGPLPGTVNSMLYIPEHFERSGRQVFINYLTMVLRPG